MMDSAEHPVMLFDGVCNLCAGSVQFIIRRDPGAKLRFASLQSEAGRALLKKFHLPEHALTSMVLIENGKAYTKSTGALRAARYLTGAWPALYALLIVPAFIRNAVYDFIGKNRYRWFGKKEACFVPTPDLQKRFMG